METNDSLWDNDTSSELLVRERRREWIWSHFAALTLITLVSVAGNALVIGVICRSRSLHTTTSVFIITLSISDLCTSLTVMLPSGIALLHTSYQAYEQHLCNILGFCYIQFRMASIMALGSISVERCTAIQVPLKYATLVTKQRTTITVIFIWIIPCFMATLPFIINLEYTYSHPKGLCVPIYRNNPAYAVLVLCGGVCIPLVVTLVMYICIARAAFKQAKRGVLVCDENHCQYVPSRKGEFKAVKTLCAVTGVFFLCWLPYTITNLWSLSTDSHINTHWDVTCEVLTFLSAALNPCMYSLLNRTFRQAFTKSYRKLHLGYLDCCSFDFDKHLPSSKASKVQSLAGKEVDKENNKEMSVLSVAK